MNLRGKFFTDEHGHIAFHSIKPAGYPIPVDGPTGELLRAQGRHNMRPAHLHFLASKDGFKTLISQIYVADDKNIDSDVQFGVTRHLIGNFVKHDGPAPAANVTGAWYSLDHNFVMEGGPSKLPRAPISGKARGERPSCRSWSECGSSPSERSEKRGPSCLPICLRMPASGPAQHRATAPRYCRSTASSRASPPPATAPGHPSSTSPAPASRRGALRDSRARSRPRSIASRPSDRIVAIERPFAIFSAHSVSTRCSTGATARSSADR